MATLINPNEVINGGIVRPAPLNARFDVMLISPNIQPAELRFIQPNVCKDMYEDMILVKNTVDCNYNLALGAIVEKFPNNPEYETLWVSYLYGICARAAMVQSLPHIAMQTGSNGIYLNNTEFSQNAGVKGLEFLQQNDIAAINVLIAAMQQFICDNRTDYPLYPATEKCPCLTGCSCNSCKGTSPHRRGKNILGWF